MLPYRCCANAIVSSAESGCQGVWSCGPRKLCQYGVAFDCDTNGVAENTLDS